MYSLRCVLLLCVLISGIQSSQREDVHGHEYPGTNSVTKTRKVLRKGIGGLRELVSDPIELNDDELTGMLSELQQPRPAVQPMEDGEMDLTLSLQNGNENGGAIGDDNTDDDVNDRYIKWKITLIDEQKTYTHEDPDYNVGEPNKTFEVEMQNE